IFVGGFTIEAAESVSSIGERAVSILQRLTDSSLVRPIASGSGRSRHALYEVVRQYALEHLAAEGRSHEVRERHARFLARWSEAKPLVDLVEDEANLNAACVFARGSGLPDATRLELRLLCALEPVRMLGGKLESWTGDLVLAVAGVSKGLRREAPHLV